MGILLTNLGPIGVSTWKPQYGYLENFREKKTGSAFTFVSLFLWLMMSFFPIGAFSKGPSNSWLEQSKVAAIFLDFFVLDFGFGVSIAVLSAEDIFHLIFN